MQMGPPAAGILLLDPAGGACREKSWAFSVSDSRSFRGERKFPASSLVGPLNSLQIELSRLFYVASDDLHGFPANSLLPV
jgi:hypothetical protein